MPVKHPGDLVVRGQRWQSHLDRLDSQCCIPQEVGRAQTGCWRESGVSRLEELAWELRWPRKNPCHVSKSKSKRKIDWWVFYALSTVFQPLNNASNRKRTLIRDISIKINNVWKCLIQFICTKALDFILVIFLPLITMPQCILTKAKGFVLLMSNVDAHGTSRIDFFFVMKDNVQCFLTCLWTLGVPVWSKLNKSWSRGYCWAR